jgi:hypothetical protein
MPPDIGGLGGQGGSKMSRTIPDKVAEELKALPYDLQCRVLEYARTLAVSAPHGVPGRHLLRFAGGIPPVELQVMRETIEAGCERIDANGW